MKIFTALNFLILLTIATIYFSYNLTMEEESTEQKKKITEIEQNKIIQSDVYQLKNHQPYMKIKSELAQYDDLGNIYATKILGLTEKEKVVFSGDHLVLNIEKKLATLTDSAKFIGTGVTHYAENIKYNYGLGKVEGHTKVKTLFEDTKTRDKFLINAEKFYGETKNKKLTYTGNVSGSLKKRLRYQKGLTFKTDKLIYDDEQSQVNLSGNVEIKQRNFTISAGNSTVYLESYNKKLKYLSCQDDIVYVEKLRVNGRSIKRVGRANFLEGINQSRQLILKGSPKVVQNDEVIKGTQIILKEKSDLIEVFDSESTIKLRGN